MLCSSERHIHNVDPLPAAGSSDANGKRVIDSYADDATEKIHLHQPSTATQEQATKPEEDCCAGGLRNRAAIRTELQITGI